jgi:Synaptobrevin/Regulated-SNARE-like domain
MYVVLNFPSMSESNLSILAAYTFHVYGRSEGVCGVIISDQEYPSLVAHQILSKILDEFLTEYTVASFQNGQKLPFPKLKEYLTKYQDPQQADSIMKIQKELDETKILMRKTIESVLERGEKIDSLVAKSDGLSAQSKMFYTQASFHHGSTTIDVSDTSIGQEAKFLLHNHVNDLTCLNSFSKILNVMLDLV